MHLGRRIINILIAFLLFLALVPTSHAVEANATSQGWKENITLTAKDIGTFTLDSNTTQMLFVEDAVPGDVWTGEITLKNQAGGPVKVSLLSITNKLPDHSLYNILDLDIWIGAKTVYSGKYCDTPQNVTDFYVIPAGSSMEMTVRVSFPPEADNQMQGKTMDSTWTFEAQYAGRPNKDTLYPYRVQYLDKSSGDPLMAEKLGYAAHSASVTEYAPNLDGYEPDAQKKTITIGSEENTITFYYKKTGNTSVPSDSKAPSDRPPDSVKTGEEIITSNTSPIVYAAIAGLSALCILIVWSKILLTKNRTEKRNHE